MSHALKNSGAPFTSAGELVHPENPKSTSGDGRAMCSCGELSDELASGAERKAWHKEHKATAEAEDLVGGEQEPTAPADSSDDVQEDSSEPTEDFPEPTVTVPFKGAAKHFWRSLGRDGTQAIATVWGVAFKADNKAQTVTLGGEDAEELASKLPAIWASANTAIREWKKTDKNVKSLDRTDPDQLDELYKSFQVFMAQYAAGVAESFSDEPAPVKRNAHAGFKAGLQYSEETEPAESLI